MIFLYVPADGASQHLFLPVAVMIAPNRTGPRPFALRKLVLCILADIVPTALLFMAGIAEVSVSPAEPLSYAATELAFELYKVFSVFGTILNRNITTTGTDQLFRFERPTSCIGFVHGSHTIFSASEVWFLTFKAHKVCIDDRCILFGLTKIRRCFIFEFWIILL